MTTLVLVWMITDNNNLIQTTPSTSTPPGTHRVTSSISEEGGRNKTPRNAGTKIQLKFKSNSSNNDINLRSRGKEDTTERSH